QISLPIVGVETVPATLTEGKVESPVTTIIKKAGDANTQITEGADLETFNIALTTNTDQVAPGDKITVKGTGLRPNTEGKVLWQSTGTNAFTQAIGAFVTDATGNFSTEATVPTETDRVLNSFGFPNTLAVSQNWNFGNVYISDTFHIVFEKIIETIFLALMATTFAIFVSLPLSFIAARNLMPRTVLGTTVYTLARTFLNILRSIESLILATIFAATVGLGPFAGVLALMVYSIASLGKFYSEAIEAIDPGPLEAITATGANRFQVIIYAVIPQFIPQFIAFTLYMWDRNVRASTIIGFVGGGGIGFLLIQYINLLDFHKAATAIWAIAIVVIIMDWVSARVRAKVI
ncbi:MAG: phosphonate ABC transporter, permease protein PhnE, partial [Chloroflexia bacterium]